ncbi:DUF4272 domain-containing protein [Hamadaea tsunoensis]|uniref:DUF4272 domain-containing protein n=1 Tax=Hamadaea tsunoensis TaxID=53368 RepID=UPI000418E862|nr:DUF4272 domain-containing protein [Hamadaea tsunoensis]
MAAVLAPDPIATRLANLAEIQRLGLPLPPESYPFVWEPGDTVALRPTVQIEARAAVLYVILERCFGMPVDHALAWLDANRLNDEVTDFEFDFIKGGVGDQHAFALHLDALAALTWMLGLSRRLDPTAPPDDHMALMPDLTRSETFEEWRSRILPAPREPELIAAVLDLYYCLDWSFQAAEAQGLSLPGVLDSAAIGQRRWGLEWAVVLAGPYQEAPVGWEEIDLST